jgi:hypothetical protein
MSRIVPLLGGRSTPDHGGASMKRIHWATLAVAVLLSAIHPPGLLAQPPGAGAVSGRVEVVLDDGTSRTVALSAATQRDGTAAGSIEFHDPSALPNHDVDGTGDAALAESKAGVTVYAQVTCLFVAEHAAIVGGEVVKADPERYVGKQVLVLMTDSERSRGVMDWGFYEPEQRVSCDSFPFAAYSPLAIAGGRTDVRQ